ncbi:MAG: DoxX family protein [Desulfobulbaceae bacterium]|nr:MAG: DoxX family protein [Desulfobulbaceae bacterium]
MKILSILSNILLAGVFAFAAIPKLADTQGFSVVIAGYGLLPETMVPLMAVILPLWELVTAVGLLFGHRWAYKSAAAMLALFILILAYGISMGLDVDCGCFGADDPEKDAYSGLGTALLRDLMLLIPLFYSWWYTRPSRSHVLED